MNTKYITLSFEIVNDAEIDKELEYNSNIHLMDFSKIYKHFDINERIALDNTIKRNFIFDLLNDLTNNLNNLDKNLNLDNLNDLLLGGGVYKHENENGFEELVFNGSFQLKIPNKNITINNENYALDLLVATYLKEIFNQEAIGKNYQSFDNDGLKTYFIKTDTIDLIAVTSLYKNILTNFVNDEFNKILNVLEAHEFSKDDMLLINKLIKSIDVIENSDINKLLPNFNEFLSLYNELLITNNIENDSKLELLNSLVNNLLIVPSKDTLMLTTFDENVDIYLENILKENAYSYEINNHCFDLITNENVVELPKELTDLISIEKGNLMLEYFTSLNDILKKENNFEKKPILIEDIS